MGEQQGKAQAEEALASIRQMLQEDAPPKPEGGAPAKLLLTPQLRVAAPFAPDPRPAPADFGTPAPFEAPEPVNVLNAAPQTAEADAFVQILSEPEPEPAPEPVPEPVSEPASDPGPEEEPYHRTALAEILGRLNRVADDFEEESPASLLPSPPMSRAPLLLGAKSDAGARAPDHSLSGRAPLPDEAALRAMVRRIIDEELQGALGARITRNIRKMVQRELSRVAAPDPD